MALAVKNTPETFRGRSFDPLLIGSLAGVVYLLASIGVAFHAIPAVWHSLIGPGLEGLLGSFVNVAMLVLVIAAAAAGFVYLGVRLIGPTAPPGLRAGIFVGFVGVILIGLITAGVGRLLEAAVGSDNAALGIGLTVLTGVGLLGLGVFGFSRPTFEKRVIQIEEQGWFAFAPYKRTQGQRVRRGTILGILVLVGSGIYTLMSHRTLNFGVPDHNHWVLALPFTDGRTIVLLPYVRFTVPILLAAASLWLAYRIVNVPAFADFLIATEAELNKVSWTTPKRLKQDTIVVLITVILLTLFLFVVDLAWSFVLSSRPIGVLQTPEAQMRKEFDDLLRRYDTNTDGYLSAEELATTVYADQFDQNDVDPKDGRISFGEYKEFVNKQKSNQQEVPW